jgi:UDP-N-acetylglucosamine 2-epimerase (non-hydrolysing)
MKIMSVVGARPNFMKVAPIIAAIDAHNSTLREEDTDLRESIQHVLVHTGQHYDRQMSDSFFADLDLPAPNVHLGVGSGSHAAQTADIMRHFEGVLLEHRPDVLIVVGDVNSTIACAMVASKVSFDDLGTRPVIAHVEAGLRSFDRAMPEEINRIVTDHLADMLFVTEQSGLENLANEGVPNEKVHLVGNTMIDSLLRYKEQADQSKILDAVGLRNGKSRNGQEHQTPYVLLTLHRPANVDCRHVLVNIFGGLEEVVNTYPVIFPAHPRTQKRIREFGLDRFFFSQGVATHGKIRLTEPCGYLDFLCLTKSAALVITDSGGIQEETTCLGVPCVTVRENTERPITVQAGTNVIAGIEAEGIREAIRRQLSSKVPEAVPPLWDGKSAWRIINVISDMWRTRLQSRADAVGPIRVQSSDYQVRAYSC